MHSNHVYVKFPDKSTCVCNNICTCALASFKFHTQNILHMMRKASSLALNYGTYALAPEIVTRNVKSVDSTD